MKPKEREIALEEVSTNVYGLVSRVYARAAAVADGNRHRPADVAADTVENLEGDGASLRVVSGTGTLNWSTPIIPGARPFQKEGS